MSKDIDFTKPLSEDDKAYVAERPWLLQDAKLRGEDIIDDEDFYVDDENADEGDEGNEDGVEGSEGDAADTADDASDDTESEDGEGDEDEVAPYAEWDYQALKDEAKNRNLSASGSKEQLVKRLEEDDASAPE